MSEKDFSALEREIIEYLKTISYQSVGNNTLY